MLYATRNTKRFKKIITQLLCSRDFCQIKIIYRVIIFGHAARKRNIIHYWVILLSLDHYNKVCDISI